MKNTTTGGIKFTSGTGSGYWTSKENALGRRIVLMRYGKKWEATVRDRDGNRLIRAHGNGKTRKEALVALATRIFIDSRMLDRNPLESWTEV